MNAQTTAPRPGKILVVDDSQIILRILSDALKSKGYQVFTATDGAGAVSLVRKEKPDLILLDLFFPLDVAYCGGGLRDGFLIIEWLRRMDVGKDIPVIVISGADPEKYKARSLAAGAVASSTSLSTMTNCLPPFAPRSAKMQPVKCPGRFRILKSDTNQVASRQAGLE